MHGLRIQAGVQHHPVAAAAETSTPALQAAAIGLPAPLQAPAQWLIAACPLPAAAAAITTMPAPRAAAIHGLPAPLQAPAQWLIAACPLPAAAAATHGLPAPQAAVFHLLAVHQAAGSKNRRRFCESLPLFISLGDRASCLVAFSVIITRDFNYRHELFKILSAHHHSCVAGRIFDACILSVAFKGQRIDGQ